jgi:hypothetical protein
MGLAKIIILGNDDWNGRASFQIVLGVKLRS